MAFTICATRAQGSKLPPADSSGMHADIIDIGALPVFGHLKKPGVLFLHDRHTAALGKDAKSCARCHQSDKGRLDYRFKRLKDTDRQLLTDLYHDNCITCHTQMTASGEKSGPLACGDCHQKKPGLFSSRAPFGFDNSLHFRHAKAQNKACNTCHHAYNKKTKKLFYAKGQEGTCRYCHKKETMGQGADRVISMPLAAHQACIDCHLKTQAKHRFAGPVQCGGCHDRKAQQAIKEIVPVPRMQRGQPDAILIQAGDQKGLLPRMMRVPFAHKAHETYTGTCRVCHHADLDKPCARCHPLTGSKTGKHTNLETRFRQPDIRLEAAFHQLNSQSSCVGCHTVQQHASDCAGCHAFMAKNRPPDSSSCLKCHMTPLPQKTGVLTTTRSAQMARLMPVIWRETFGPSRRVNVPKEVIINNMVDQYGPVKFPHRKIFNAIVKRVGHSKLAQYFHGGKTTLCQGCHHHTPVAGKPPLCSSCHGKPFDQKDFIKPGLKSSYHRQCLGCHQKMGIKRVSGCTDCHKERKLQAAKTP